MWNFKEAVYFEAQLILKIKIKVCVWTVQKLNTHLLEKEFLKFYLNFKVYYSLNFKIALVPVLYFGIFIIDFVI